MERDDLGHKKKKYISQSYFIFLTWKLEEKELDERKISLLAHRIFHFTDTREMRDPDLSISLYDI